MAQRGHRVAPHTADLIVEAWGPTRVACLEEIATALVESFCDVRDAPVAESVPVAIDADSDLDVLAELLEEIVYLAEVTGVVPVTLSLTDAGNGGVAGFFEVAPVDAVETTGAVPKGVSYGELRLAAEDGRWSGHAVVDV